MIWGAGAIILGICLGYLSYLYSRAIYYVYAISYFLITIVSIVFLESKVDTIGGASNFLTAPIDVMGLLPRFIQVAIVIFGVSFVVTRVIVWMRRSKDHIPFEKLSEKERMRRLNELSNEKPFRTFSEHLHKATYPWQQ